jgi:hypothetical protein
MITSIKIEFWLRHRDWPDILDRGSAKERATLSHQEWTWLEETVAKLRLARSGLLATALTQATERELLACVEAGAIATLQSVVESKPSPN